MGTPTPVGDNSIEKTQPIASSTTLMLTKCYLCSELLNAECLDCSICKISVHISCLPEGQKPNSRLWTCGSCASKDTRPKVDEQKVGDQQPRPGTSQKRSSVSSKSSVRRKQELRIKKLEEEKQLQFKELQLRIQLEKEFLDKKYKLLEEECTSSDGESEVASEVGSKKKVVEDWLKKVDEAKDKEGEAQKLYGDSQVNHNNNNNQNANQEHITVKLNPGAEAFRPVCQRQGVDHHVDLVRKGYGRLTREDIAARHESRALPNFTGDIFQWSTFYSAFKSTTARCNFDNYENMSRLREALKGEAKDSVEALLNHENNVDEIISTLKMLYGREDQIIFSLIEKIDKKTNVRMDNLNTLIKFQTSVSNLVANIKSFEMLGHLENPCLLQKLIKKLPNELKLQWGSHKLMSSNVNLITFNDWLRFQSESACEVRTLESKDFSLEVKTQKERSKGFINVHDSVDTNEDVTSKKLEVETRKCPACYSSCPSIKSCALFMNCSYNRRKRLARKLKLCYLCLERHSFKSCKSVEVCGVDDCKIRHHKLLHNSAFNHVPKRTKPEHKPNVPEGTEPDQANHPASEKVKPDAEYKEVPEKSNQDKDNYVNSTSEDLYSSKVVYRIAPITLHGNGQTLDTYAFLDDGSALTLLDEDVAIFLGLKGDPSPLCLRWTGNVTRMEEKSQVLSLNVSANKEGQQYTLSNVRTVNNLGLPSQTLDKSVIISHKHFQGLPISSYERAQPKILIGLNNSKLGLTQKARYVHESGLIATKTVLGWIVHGVTGYKGTVIAEPTLNLHQCECDLHHMVKKHFTLENLGVCATSHQLPSLEEERAMSLLQKFSRRIDGRFEAPLLWAEDNVKLPNNFEMAVRRHMSLEKRLSKDPNLAVVMENTIQEYIAKGYARLLSNNEASEFHPRLWYLPIFPVVNVNKPGKVRIVWDAAATYKGVSLNSKLLTGPDQLTSLIGVLFRFRENRIAVAADIRQMFHQIRIRRADWSSQRFVWRKSPNDTLQIFEMMVMTFGASCSPSCAQFIKNKNAEEFRSKCGTAVDAILFNHYVDDYLDSYPDEKVAVQIANEVREIHHHGGFELRNWISNSSNLLESLNENEVEDTKSLNMSSGASDKVLGMWWSTLDDCFHFKVKIDDKNSGILSGDIIPTKRQVLSTAMKIFDPLGFLGHVIIFLKIILKRVWKSSVGWDEPIKDDSFSEWMLWLKVMPTISEMKVPRCYLKSNKNLQLHIFVDAGMDGLAAVAYFRSEGDCGVSCSLVASKTRVTPSKITSMPRLELQAAVLGTRLAKFVQREHRLVINRRVFWSDSKTVLTWLKRDHTIFKQFVAFRIGEILEETELNEWRYVNTKDNVADHGTKWKSAPTDAMHSEWFNGPRFLRNLETEWDQPLTEIDELETSELQLHRLVSTFQVIDVKRFSKWLRMVRALAYALRFIECLRTKRINTDILRQDELNRAELLIFKQAQSEEYWPEISMMEEDLHLPFEERKYVSKSSSLYKLSPFLDENHVLRVYGRIGLSMDVGEDTKQPTILPRKHPITRLLVLFYHEKYSHNNTETVANELRQTFHIPKVKSVIFSVRASCPTCIFRRAKPRSPMMSDLPKSRLSIQTRPFTFIGIDYFGPMKVTRGRVLEKRWGVLVTCLTIRAVHIEVAENLTTDSCILALNRFMARRGVPQEIFCDNGTNFRGVETELRNELKKLDINRFAEKFTTSSSKWNFNPPASPHMGGSWERMVRSIKKAMYEILPKMPRNPSNELLHSILVAAENLVNSRPLTYVPVESTESEILTPNHFLLGSSNGIRADGEFNDEAELLRKNWMVLQQQRAAFCRRWVKEYLPTLTRRTKWFEPTEPLKVGDLVLICDNLSPLEGYRRGIITKVFTGKNNVVRSAVVRTNTGEFTRPAVKLAVIDVDGNVIQDHLQGGSVNNSHREIDSLSNSKPSAQ